MSKRIEMNWEVMRTDEAWDGADEADQPPVSTASSPKKNGAYTLLATAALACMLIVSLWAGDAPVEGEIGVETAAIVYSGPATPDRHRIDAPQAPLEYWEEKFYVEEVLGREYAKTPLQYWEDKFFRQEVGGR